MLVGDIEKPVELAFVEQQKTGQDLIALKSDVMIAPHHGSKTSSSVEFVNAVQPKLTIFTVGYLNRFRHPGPEIVNRYEDAQSNMLRSDYHGAVTLDFVANSAANSTEGNIQAVSWRKQNRRYWHDVYD